MLTRIDADKIAHALLGRYGEAALAGAVLQTQWAAKRGETVKLRDWARIAEATERALPV
jgi:hypothetical protein